MSLSINKFINSIKGSAGLLNPTRYRLIVSGPKGIMGDSHIMRVTTTQWPGKTIESVDSFIGVGPPIKVPIGEMYDNFPLTVYSSKDLNEHLFWNSWMEFISGDKFLIKHYNEIVGIAQLDVLDEAGLVTKSVKLISCYPTILGPIEMGYELTNQIATFSVELIYHHYEVIS